MLDPQSCVLDPILTLGHLSPPSLLPPTPPLPPRGQMSFKVDELLEESTVEVKELELEVAMKECAPGVQRLGTSKRVHSWASRLPFPDPPVICTPCPLWVG